MFLYIIGKCLHTLVLYYCTVSTRVFNHYNNSYRRWNGKKWHTAMSSKLATSRELKSQFSSRIDDSPPIKNNDEDILAGATVFIFLVFD